jgi:hypothetical protein
VQLPKVVGQLVQAIRPDQPAEHEQAADDAIVASRDGDQQDDQPGLDRAIGHGAW